MRGRSATAGSDIRDNYLGRRQYSMYSDTLYSTLSIPRNENRFHGIIEDLAVDENQIVCGLLAWQWV
jgi:hypothetical protein